MAEARALVLVAALALASAGAGAETGNAVATLAGAGTDAATSSLPRGGDRSRGPEETPPPAPSWLRDATVDIRLRTFADHQNIDDRVVRHAVVQGLLVFARTGLTPGPVGFGLDAAGFAAWRVAGSPNAGNMGHSTRDGRQASAAWAYPGLVDLRAEAASLSVRIGTQTLSDPFLEAQFNRALPPAFLGASGSWRASPQVSVQSAYVTKVVPRGQTHLRTLTTSYGGVAVDHFFSAGVVREVPGAGKLSLFLGEAADVWRQLNAGASLPIARADTVALRADANAYLTEDAGARREGAIDNLAYSLSLSAVRGESRIGVSYQQVVSRQFFDYLSETSGGTLENAAVVDFNAPRERSVKLRFVAGPDDLGVRGWKVSAWATTGWGADGRPMAARHADTSDPLHALYWRNGVPIAGRHDEVGLSSNYVVPEGRFREARLSLVAVVHRSDRTYSDPAVHEYRVILDVPLH